MEGECSEKAVKVLGKNFKMQRIVANRLLAICL
jgi:hypothetical protein